MTISDVPTQTLTAEGEVGLVDIGSLTTESGEVNDDVCIAVQRWGKLSRTRQRGGGAARAHRPILHRRMGRQLVDVFVP
jgi:hypothetical protein